MKPKFYTLTDLHLQPHIVSLPQKIICTDI